MIDAFAIVNKRGEILFYYTFNCQITRVVFQPFLSELTSSSLDLPPELCSNPKQIKDGHQFVHIRRDDFYWLVLVHPGSLTQQCGNLFVVECLAQLHRTCQDFCGTLTQHSIISNSTLLFEIVQEMMNGGIFQVQTTDKIKANIYSSVVAPKETCVSSTATGLFGLEKVAPSQASQQSVLNASLGKQELFVDVVENVWAVVDTSGTVVRADVSGSVKAKCFLQGSVTLGLIFNCDLSTTPTQGFNTNLRMSEVEYHDNADTTQLISRHQLAVPVSTGEMVLARYTLAPDNPHMMPFTLTANMKPLTASDPELSLKLISNTDLITVSPQVTVRLQAPPTTAAVMSRTMGLRGQKVEFSPTDKSLRWQIVKFPGGGQAQAIVRFVDGGGNSRVDSAELEFEVSQWTCSGLRVDRVRLTPPIDHCQKWVRYLTTSDGITIKF